MADARFPIITARQELGFTPATAVRGDIDTRTGDAGAAIGQAVISGAEALLERSARKQAIEQKRQDMLDTRSSIIAGSFITTAINENIAFRSTNADTKTWAKDLQERLNGAETQIGDLDMSEDTRLLVNAKFQAETKEALSRSLIAETDRDREDTRDAIITDVVEQYTNGTAQDQKDAAMRFLEIAPALMDKNEARATLKTAIMAGQKARSENAVKAKENEASLDPIGVKQEMIAEKELREQGKVSPENSLLSNKDLESIIDYADSVSDKAVSDSKIAADAAVRASYKNIISGGTNITEMAGLILADLTMMDDDKTAAVDKIRAFFSTWNSAIDEKIKTSDPTRIKALKIISDVRTADITEDEGLAQYIRLSKSEKINGTDGKQFINDIFTASKSAEKDPLSTNRAKIYFGNLESLYTDNHIKPLEYDKMHTALRDFFEQDPIPTPEQASSFYSELVEPVVLNWFERLMWLKGRKQLFGIVGTEEERLAKKKKEAGIIGEDELTNMTDEELEAIIRGK